jgi:hypothetical protein
VEIGIRRLSGMVPARGCVKITTHVSGPSRQYVPTAQDLNSHQRSPSLSRRRGATTEVADASLEP